MSNRIFCAIALAAVTFASAQSVTVNAGTQKQYIRGFGGINLPEWAGDLTAAQRETAFGNGTNQLGLSVLRIFINDQSANWSKAVTTAKDASDRGLTVFATPWNPPDSMTETVTRNNRSEKRLKYASYGNYATHLVNFENYMKNSGVNLYALSFANEPDYGYDWTWYSADEVYNFTKNYASQLRVGTTKVITAESFAYSKTYYNQILNDSAALANIDIIGTHFYASDSSTANSFYQYALADSKAPTKERWMTEYYTSSKDSADVWPLALDVPYSMYHAMVEGNFSVYTWWYIRRFYSLIKEDGNISKRGYCFAQYSKYVRPGYYRVDATKNPATGLYISAYTGKDSLVIVALNRNSTATSATFTLNGFNADSYTKISTTSTKNLNNDGSGTVSGNKFTLSFEGHSTTTLLLKSTTPVSSSSSAESSSSVAQTAYSANAIPGTIEAENYDNGGQNNAYYDTDDTTQGKVYRTDGVDVVSATDGYAVGYTVAGEWMEYTVNVAKAGIYSFGATVASGSKSSSFQLFLDGAAITDTVKVDSSSWTDYSTVSGTTTGLTAGTHVLKIAITGSYVNIDRIAFTDGTTKITTSPAAKLTAGTYRIFDLQGNYLGQVSLYASEAPGTQVLHAVKRPGLYILRSQSRTFTVNVNK